MITKIVLYISCLSLLWVFTHVDGQQLYLLDIIFVVPITLAFVIPRAKTKNKHFLTLKLRNRYLTYIHG